MINTTRWSPDTCGCTVEYQWDTTTPEDQRVHTPINTVISCPAHSVVGLNVATHYNTLLSENTRKNKVHGQLLTISNLTQTITNSDGTQTVTFKNGVGFTYTWSGIDGARVISISVFGVTLTTAQKNSVQSWCDTNIGVGKVIIL